MIGKGRKLQAEVSSSTSVPHFHPIYFKKSRSKLKSKSARKLISTNQNPNHANLQQLPDFTHRRHWNILTTMVFSLFSATASAPPCVLAVGRVDGAGGDDQPQFLHPLTLKPYPSKLSSNFDLNGCQITSLVNFDLTNNFPFEKLVMPLPRAATVDGDAMVVLYGGGKLLGRLPLVSGNNSVKWVVLSKDKFDDIVACIGCTYVVDRLGRLYVINNITHSRVLSLGPALTTEPLPPRSVQVGWRKRLTVDKQSLFMVVRVEEKVFKVYELTRGTSDCWVETVDFGRDVLFMSKHYCFFMDYYKGDEYENCIVFAESAFPKYGSDDCWEYNDDDQIGVFRMADGRFGRAGDSVDFPDIDWSLPFSEASAEVVPASLFASVSAVEKEVTRTLLLMNGGNEATQKESSKKISALSVPTACTSSFTKGNNGDVATAKFEGFDIRSDLVPTLQKIWRNHGNITENSTIRNSDIIARGLESLGIMVQILENNSVESLSDCQAEYLNSTLCDLKLMGLKVHWLVRFVEKGVKLRRSKALVDSLNKLKELSSQVRERRDILLNGAAKLTEEENKLKKQMAKVSKAIPFSELVKFDDILGSGLT